MSDITPEQIAAALTGGSDVNEVLNGWVDVSAEGNVAHITYTPVKATRWSSGPDRKNAKRFRAPVVEGDGPVVIASPELLAAARALYRWNAAASTLAADQFAALVYEVEDALAALTPEQIAVLAGDDEQGGAL